MYYIAEMSANHGGSLDRALEIVHSVAESGASCLKIQTYTADSMTIDCDNDYFKIKGGLWNGYKLYDLYKKAGTPYEWLQPIKTECDKSGIDFLCTPFDEKGVDELEKIEVSAYKIASFELVHIPLLKYVAKTGKPLILSCGMATAEEIDNAIEAVISQGLTKEKITLLKCTSEYPAHFNDMNLSTIPDMKKRFGCKVGFSDHSPGYVADVVAVSLGATVIEKHFCLDREIKTPDSEFSMEPEEFSDMITACNNAYSSLGELSYIATGTEKDSLVFRRSIFAVDDIQSGDKFTKDNIEIIRPGYGMKPKYYEQLLNTSSMNNYKRGEPISEDI
ncbi:MAG: pseudaminic acid synthase [Oscillospiraceae bacterium]|jgi:pseudaminic acid synthase|nr:pseudaminic acid synthase [Oscillospiraceae bacterium]